MVTGPTVAVLAPITGGFYYGGLLTGITREVAAAGGRVLLVQTLDAGLSGDDVLEAPEFGNPTARDVADGFLALAASTRPLHLDKLRAEGRPVVLVGHTADGLGLRSAMPDNAGGVHAAVAHLVREHGHTRIGFIGNLSQSDMQERFAAYEDAMRLHGLAPAPCFHAPDNALVGGRAVAARLVADGLPVTAVVVATDRNALGVVEGLREAGVSVPADVAVTGFDDVEGHTSTAPCLTTVNQQFDRVGALGARLLLAELRRDAVAPGRHTSPGELVLRTSCGCPGTLGMHAGEVPAGALRGDGAREPAGLPELHRALHAALQPDPHQPAAGAALAAAVDVVAQALEAVAAGGEDPGEAPPARAAALLQELRPTPEALRVVSAVVGEHVMRVVAAHPDTGAPGREPDRQRLIALHSRIVSALWSSTTARLMEQWVRQEATIAEQYAVSMSLLHRGGGDPRSLDWMTSTHVGAGCVALWEDGPDGERLRVAGVHDRHGDLAARLGGEVLGVRSFPPRALLERADPAAQEVAYVLPVRARGSDWGLLAVVGRIDAQTLDARATYNHWAALLAVAFEQEQLLVALRASEEQQRRRALHDAVTGLPNRTLFLELLTRALEGPGDRTSDGAGGEFAVLFLDLDGFKQVNDTLGHHAGDRLLVAVAERLLGAMRPGDVAARFGGDEFAVLLAAPAEEVVAIVERMQRAIALPVLLDGRPAAVSASVGIAVRRRGRSTAEQALRDADQAMYRAKSARRGSWVLDADGGGGTV
ncbi:diguanylate cyclase (GGDEF)-like protein [Kineococcus xinjiangensis]|uniref:Diguanylate cyclase (GGDEF)-like protein n=1 Tax=Kineococcus xinjiangensis TaxID=512762 RepID=A0A2S6IEJ3_9ACTN|nr:GGDEF domain-containing protein [Kineococcus xinjiangensis]PPK92638.1 diguanylate cyclase (GGDEF)-like protein [Kineococcus xinjiangensis]